MDHLLSKGAVRQMRYDDITEPLTVQVLQITLVGRRHVLLLSDGDDVATAILHPRLDGLCLNGELKVNQLIEMIDWEPHRIDKECIIELFDAQVSWDIPNPTQRIGNPIAVPVRPLSEKDIPAFIASADRLIQEEIPKSIPITTVAEARIIQSLREEFKCRLNQWQIRLVQERIARFILVRSVEDLSETSSESTMNDQQNTRLEEKSVMLHDTINVKLQTQREEKQEEHEVLQTELETQQVHFC